MHIYPEEKPGFTALKKNVTFKKNVWPVHSLGAREENLLQKPTYLLHHMSKRFISASATIKDEALAAG